MGSLPSLRLVWPNDRHSWHLPGELRGTPAARHAAHHGVLGVHAVAEEEAQVGREGVDVHAPAEIVLHVGEAVGQGEGELADGVGAGLRDVVAADADAVEVADLPIDEGGLGVPRLKCSRVACYALAGLVRASGCGTPGSLLRRASSVLASARPFLRRAAASPAHVTVAPSMVLQQVTGTDIQ